MTDPLRTTREDDVLLVQLDDGKANALSSTMIGAIHGALDEGEKEASALVIAGRPGRFSGGFDLQEMGSGGTAARDLVGAGAELCLRLLTYPKPVVAACTGHAIAAGILLVSSCDYRVGARGDFKLGLNEVAIGMILPHFAREIARMRVSKRHLDRAALHAEFYAPEDALDAGFLDALVAPDALLATASGHAKRLAALDPRAFAGTKRALHEGTVSRIRDHLADDLRALLPAS